MAIASTTRVIDLAIPDLTRPACELIRIAAQQDKPDPDRRGYDSKKKHLRWLCGLSGEASPVSSPLSVDIAQDPAFKVYRYDWLFGVSCVSPAEFYWDWQEPLRQVVAHIIVVPTSPAVSHTCLTTVLNVLPPARHEETWWQRNRPVVNNTLLAAGVAADTVQPGVGAFTKAVSVLANSLDSQAGGKTNWFVYQFLDEPRNAAAIEWRIERAVVRQYGPLLRGSLVLAFHRASEPAGHEDGSIRLIFKPMLAYAKDELAFVAPTELLPEDQQVAIDIRPGLTGERERKS